MGFRFDDIGEHLNSGILKGIQREIACECWFTSQGKTIPKKIKVMDEEGMLHTIGEIQVLTSEKKNYSGIATVEHLCRLRVGDRMETAKLIFSQESCKWTIVEI